MTGAWSEPELGIFDHVQETLETDGDSVLATIVDVDGNAYRRPGAKMVVDDGESFGHITAGCLENEVLTLARSVVAEESPLIETFDLMDDDIWGLGMGCNGIIDVLLEPIDARHRPVVEAYRAGEAVASLTVLESSVDGLEPFARAIYRPGEGFLGVGPATAQEDPYAPVLEDLEPTVASALDDGHSVAETVEIDAGTARVFVDGFRPPAELVVVGTGPDVDPVVELARRNEYRVTVVGFRGGSVEPERFPAATVHATSPRSLHSSVDFDENTHVVVMTHNYVDDRLTLEALLETPVPSISVVGARERVERMLGEIREEEGSLDRDDRERIYAPAGLDLGGGSPNQIATSIVAELLAVHNDREPRHLRSREGPIHARLDARTDR